MSTHHEKMKHDVESTVDSLFAPTLGVSCADATQQLSTIGDEYFKKCSQPTAQAAQGTDEEKDEGDSYHGNSTPGVPQFFSTLWEAVIERIHRSPVEEQARDEYITRLVDFVGKIKHNSHPEGNEWSIMGEKCDWKDLPLLGQTIRDHYNEPIDTMDFEPSSVLSQDSQAAVAGASQLEPQQLRSEGSESDIIHLAKSRHQWLSLQSFISRLWRDCGCDSYALYAIWALRSGLEDWPESPPAYGSKCNTLEESPAYLAFQVEAAAIWIYNTAPLMYKCTEIWGPKGDPDWSRKAGAPGRGGRRWDGVDGYDREHKRWQLWKDVLNEVVQWCDGPENDKLRGWKVKGAAIRALGTMEEAERR
ncbi:unnamed protein product [Rhizoctonia solani]|uniref:Uncharacterized protein n=1 Tax=Rhizoctonia solani TaxID=456999 RepID=A0A8H2W7J6_9AGAM|nr:unnamed protein product [Rhizoctonia solani]